MTMRRLRIPAFIVPGPVLAAIARTETRNTEPIYIAATISETGLRSASAVEMENGYRMGIIKLS